MRKINKIDILQIEAERKGFLELLLIVVILGFILNFLVSAIFELVYGTGSIWIVLIAGLVLIITILIYIFFGLIKPIRIENSIPIVLFFDNENKTIAIPVEIHAPQQPIHRNKYYDISIRAPFTSICRSTFDDYKELVGNEDYDENSMELSKALIELIQHIFITQYINSHSITWNPFENEVVGPFDVGSGYSLPEKKIGVNLINYQSKNRFVKDRQLTMIFPEKTKVKFYSDNFLSLENPFFNGKINIYPSGFMGNGSLELSRGIFSAWHRELSSDDKNTTAFLFSLRMVFEVKATLWRFYAEDRLKTGSSSKITIDDICKWINDWIETAFLFFDWVDEDLSDLPDVEKDKLIHRKSTIYKRATYGFRYRR